MVAFRDHVWDIRAGGNYFNKYPDFFKIKQLYWLNVGQSPYHRLAKTRVKVTKGNAKLHR